MTSCSVAPFPSGYVPDTAAIDRRFTAALMQLRSRTDRMIAILLVVHWFAIVGVALFISLQTWEGQTGGTHINVWAEIFLGGAICLYPCLLYTSRCV